MRTINYKTSNSLPPHENVVDLAQFRRRQELAQRDTLARKPASSLWNTGEPPAFRPVVLSSTPEERRRARRQRRAWILDAGASLAVILTTAVFALRMLL